MDPLLDGFQERLAEVDAYLDFLSSIEASAQLGVPRLEGVSQPISTQQQRILYSGVYLQLYNLVESTMSRCIEAVTDAAKQGGHWQARDLAEQLRKEWVRATARTHEDLNPEHRLESAIHLFHQLANSLPISVFEIDRGGGGNWDDVTIAKFSERLGCNLQVSDQVKTAAKKHFKDEMGALALVKHLRNRLAHGNISFAQCAEEETVARLIDLKGRTVAYLEAVIQSFSSYLAGNEFLQPALRPA